MLLCDLRARPRKLTACPLTACHARLPLPFSLPCRALQVTPVTLINTEYALHHYRQNAVSGSYLCYGLKQGHIRVLSRHSAVRALLKGHSKPLTDLQFAPAAAGADGKEEDEDEEEDYGSLLASGGQDGQLFVWQLRLDEGEAAIHDTRKLHAHFVTAAGGHGWRPQARPACQLLWQRQGLCGRSVYVALLSRSSSDACHCPPCAYLPSHAVHCRLCRGRVPVVALDQQAGAGCGRGRQGAACGRAC